MEMELQRGGTSAEVLISSFFYQLHIPISYSDRLRSIHRNHKNPLDKRAYSFNGEDAIDKNS